jgi:hypothetical protein
MRKRETYFYGITEIMVIMLSILLSSLPVIAESTTDTVNTAQFENWRKILNDFPPNSDWSEERKQQTRDQFLAEDVDKMPSEWRYAFIDVRLWWYQVNGNWDGMIAIRDKLMSVERPDPKQSLLDADLLYKIASYFIHVVFYPPTGHASVTDMEAHNYWKKNYFSDAEAEKIYQYIVDHFDMNYATTVEALDELAGCQLRLNKDQQALDNLKRLENINLSKLYSVDRIHVGLKAMRSGSEQLKKNELPSLEISKRKLPENMAASVTGLPREKRLEELTRIEEKYKNSSDPEIMETIRKVREDIKRMQESDR